MQNSLFLLFISKKNRNFANQLGKLLTDLLNL